MESETDKPHASNATARQMNSPGLRRGSSGNVPIRNKNGLMFTATGRFHETATADGVYSADADSQVRCLRAPSCERRFCRGVPGTPAPRNHAAQAVGQTPFLSDVQTGAVIDNIADCGLTAKDGR